MKLLFLILFIFGLHSSLSQESSNDEIIGIWTVIDAGVTAYAICGTFDFSETIGTRFEFLNCGQLNIYDKNENVDQKYVNLQWSFITEATMTIKSKNEEIDYGRVKFYFHNNKLYLDNNVFGMILEKK